MLGCAVFCLYGATDGSFAADWDLVIRHGTILDGTGKEGFPGEVAVKDGRITQVGKVTGNGTKEVDATGLMVSPGFVDIHTHAEDILKGKDAENFIRMGVTTVIVGNCGASILNVAGFLEDIQKGGVAINVGTLIGHNAIRGQVMGGSFMRPPTDSELAGMKQMVDQAMNDGAFGLSTGLIYLPGKYAKTEEIIELARVAAAHHGIYTSHVRDEQEGLIDSMKEAFRVGREAGIPVELSHFKLSGNLIYPQEAASVTFLERARGEGLAAKVVAAFQSAQQDGVKVTADLYGYSAATIFVDRLLPAFAREGGTEAMQHRLAEPTERSRIADEMKRELQQSGRADFSHVVIVTARRYKSIQSLPIPEAARERRGNNSLESQIDLILSLAQNGGATVIVYENNEADLLPLLRLPETMIASDSGAFQGKGEMRHPRNYGSAARILARYVRKEKQLTMPDAIRKMTSLPATTFQLKDRGEIRSGAWADLVVFDPARVQDNSTYGSPNQAATGFRAVIVNGVITAENDQENEARAGKPVRMGK